MIQLMTLEIFWIFLSFLCGSLPISVWLGRIFMGVDVRQVGDGNPGASNVFKSGNNYIGLLALLLDITKAALPVGFAFYNLDIRGLPMILIASAPVLGHAFSPFLHFKGGKALATTLGVWIGLTLWKVSLPAAAGAVIGVSLVTPTGWGILFALGVILATLLLWFPTPFFFSVWLIQTLILIWTHRFDFQKGFHIRSWLGKILFRRRN